MHITKDEKKNGKLNQIYFYFNCKKFCFLMLKVFSYKIVFRYCLKNKKKKIHKTTQKLKIFNEKKDKF